MKVFTYARVSTSEQELEIQQNRMAEEIKYKGWELSGQTVDKGISGGKGRDKRKGFNELCEAIEAGKVDVVMAWAVDRVSRSVSDFIGFMMLCDKHNVKTYFINSPGASTATPEGKFFAQMLANFAEYERAMISSRMKESYAYRRMKGKTNFGRNKKVMKYQEERILELKGEGVSCRDIAKQMNLGLGTIGRIVAKA